MTCSTFWVRTSIPWRLRSGSVSVAAQHQRHSVKACRHFRLSRHTERWRGDPRNRYPVTVFHRRRLRAVSPFRLRPSTFLRRKVTILNDYLYSPIYMSAARPAHHCLGEPLQSRWEGALARSCRHPPPRQATWPEEGVQNIMLDWIWSIDKNIHTFRSWSGRWCLDHSLRRSGPGRETTRNQNLFRHVRCEEMWVSGDSRLQC